MLEDDLIVEDNFLEFMNEALDFYNKNNTIWSIAGYTPNLKCLESYEKDIFLSTRASSWGWATWKNRWDKIEWEIKDWNTFKKDKKLINKFNLGGDDMFKMLETQMMGKIDSWAIRWCYNQFKYNMYTIYPTKSISNLPGAGIGNKPIDGSKRWEVKSSNKVVKLEEIKVDNDIINCFKEKYNLKLKTKFGYLLKQYGGYNFVKKISIKISKLRNFKI